MKFLLLQKYFDRKLFKEIKYPLLRIGLNTIFDGISKWDIYNIHASRGTK